MQHTRQHTRIGALLALIVSCLLGHAAGAEPCSTIVDLKQAALRTGQLTEMMSATHLAGLDDPEVDVGPLTLLAPTDEAFRALPAGFRARLLAPENRQHLVALLMHHAVMGEFSFERLKKARAPEFTIPTVDAGEVLVSIRPGMTIEGAKLVEANIQATNGIIHLIDRVLIPPSVKAALWDDNEVAPRTDKLAEHAE